MGRAAALIGFELPRPGCVFPKSDYVAQTMRASSLGSLVSMTMMALTVASIPIGAGCSSSEQAGPTVPADDGSTPPGNGPPDGGPGKGDTGSGEAGLALVQTPGTYAASCDGSGGVSIDGSHFLAFNDENQILRIYRQGGSAPAVQELDVSESLGLTSKDEADFEDAARVGNRIYVIGSHGRKKTGKLDEARYKFFAIDLAGAVPAVSMKVAGSYSNLLSDLLDSSNWATPNTAVVALLESTSQLSKDTVASLAPKENGTNIEGLVALPGGRLAIGFRNPKQSSDAIVVTLLNRDAVLTGSMPQFGEAIMLKLGGFGIRGMAWSEVHQRVLILSGPHDETQGPFALWTWTGTAGSAPVKAADLTTPANAAPEAIVPYAGTKDVQVLFDMSAFAVAGGECADAPIDQKRFTDVVIHVD
jgi:hypothetical protein